MTDDLELCAMAPYAGPTSTTEWDEQTVGWAWHKTADLQFLGNMTGDLCDEADSEEMNRWCVRIPGHTGRHLAIDPWEHYPVAVWK